MQKEKVLMTYFRRRLPRSEASVRTIGLRHFDVQLVGGIALHKGTIAEMKTGEVRPLCLHWQGTLMRFQETAFTLLRSTITSQNVTPVDG